MSFLDKLKNSGDFSSEKEKEEEHIEDVELERSMYSPARIEFNRYFLIGVNTLVRLANLVPNTANMPTYVGMVYPLPKGGRKLTGSQQVTFNNCKHYVIQMMQAEGEFAELLAESLLLYKSSPTIDHRNLFVLTYMASKQHNAKNIIEISFREDPVFRKCFSGMLGECRPAYAIKLKSLMAPWLWGALNEL